MMDGSLSVTTISTCYPLLNLPWYSKKLMQILLVLFGFGLTCSTKANELNQCFDNIRFQPQEADRYCQQLLKQTDNKISQNERSRIYIGLATLANRQSNFIYASSLLDLAITENDHLQEDNLYRYNWLRISGTVKFQQEQFDQALPLLLQGFELAKKLDIQSLIGTSANDVASVYMELGRYHQAMTHYQQAIDVFSSIDNLYSLALSLSGIGLAYKDLGDLDTATNFLKRAINSHQKYLQESPGDDYSISILADTRFRLAEVYIDGQQYELAGPLLQEALVAYQSEKKFAESIKIYTALSRIALAQQNVQDALGFILSALEIQNNENLFSGLSVSQQLAEVYLANEQTEKAITVAKQGLQNASKQQHFQSQLFFLKWLGEVYSKQEPKEALGYLTQYLKLYKTYLNNKYNPAIADLQAVIEVKQQQQDIALLEKDRQIDQVKLQQQRWLILIISVFTALFAWLGIRLWQQKARQNIALKREVAMHRNELNRLTEQDQQENEPVLTDDQEDPQDLDTPSRHKQAFHQKLVELMCMSCDFWEQSSGQTQIELAERSKIWLVVIDDGRLRTRTMDKYLDISRLPKMPRWRQVIRTCRFVLVECDLTNTQRDKLNQNLEDTLSLQRQIAMNSDN